MSSDAVADPTPTRAARRQLAAYRDLFHELAKLRARLWKLERRFVKPLDAIHRGYRVSAQNLVHYVALRRHDVRRLQRRLSAAGLSSLGHSEAAVLANLNAVIDLLGPLARRPVPRDPDFRAPVALDEGREILTRHTRALFGREPRKRSTRIMVTLPTEAATDRDFVAELVRRGMNCARINCAHDTPADWVKMADNVRRAAKQVGTPCRVLMDLGGPKVRTGRIDPGPAVVKWRPVRDRLGRVVAPAVVLLRARGRVPALEEGTTPTAALTVPRRFISRLAVGDVIRFRDARNASRSLVVTRHSDGYCLADARSTAYVTNGTRFKVRGRANKAGADVTLGGIPREEQGLLVQPGDTLVLSRKPIAGRQLQVAENGDRASPAAIVFF
jgi:pyruvate kinase